MPAPLHHPPHIYLDDTWYFITSSIYQRHRLLQSVEAKELVRDQLSELAREFKLQLAAWVILDNHYHILAKSHIGKELSRFIGRLHGRVSHDLNDRDNAHGRQVWHNFWDTCIRSDADYWIRFNYIHHNPVKHGYTRQMSDWVFSSYRFHLERKGVEWMMETFEKYPIVDFTDPRDSFG